MLHTGNAPATTRTTARAGGVLTTRARRILGAGARTVAGTPDTTHTGGTVGAITPKARIADMHTRFVPARVKPPGPTRR